MKLYHHIAQQVHRLYSDHVDHARDAEENLVKLEKFLPTGSGFDSGTRIDIDSKVNKVSMFTSFHHMDQSGGYDGWTEHRVIMTPSLIYCFNLKITGRDRNLIKDYIYEQFEYLLSREVKTKYENGEMSYTLES